MDFAVRAGKPFAVVPCCVFPRCGHVAESAMQASVLTQLPLMRVRVNPHGVRLRRVALQALP